MPDTILVAGATGAIGRRLSRLLVQDGWTVTGTTRSPRKAQSLRAMGVQPAIVDVLVADAIIDVACGIRPAVVIHQLTDLPAGLDPARMRDGLARTARLRETGTRNLLRAAIAAGARRLVAQSIAFAYAAGPRPRREDSPLDLDSATRRQTVRAIASLERQVLDAPLDGIVLRYGRLYGPGTGVDRPRDGTPVHVDAAADAARRAINRGQRGIYNIAEDDGSVSIDKATHELEWTPGFRMGTPDP